MQFSTLIIYPFPTKTIRLLSSLHCLFAFTNSTCSIWITFSCSFCIHSFFWGLLVKSYISNCKVLIAGRLWKFVQNIVFFALILLFVTKMAFYLIFFVDLWGVCLIGCNQYYWISIKNIFLFLLQFIWLLIYYLPLCDIILPLLTVHFKMLWVFWCLFYKMFVHSGWLLIWNIEWQG